MNVQQQIAKLESLLDRIRRNAEAPRPVAASEVSPHSAAPPTARGESPPPPAAVYEPAHAAANVAFDDRSVEVELTATEELSSAEVEEMDMMDAEIVELGAPADDLDEPVPASSPRPATSQMFAEPEPEEADIEPPIKTPPPESGRQVVVTAPRSPVFHAEEADIDGSDVDALLEPDLSGGPISKAPPGVPAMEQLGETVELIGADAPDAELELAPVPELGTEAPLDDLEMSLPNQAFGGGYHAELAAPAGADDDLARHRREVEREAAPSVPAALASSPSIAASIMTSTGPAVFERPHVDVVHVAEMVLEKPMSVPSTFVEVLDGSLSLRAG